MTPNLHIDPTRIADFCRRQHIRRLELSGSVLGDDFGPASDVDVLYEFEPGMTPGFGIFRVEEELSQILGGRKVDLVPAKYLSKYVRRHPKFRTELIYEQ